jgi:outer membrane receptor protein involved in Fe transport
MSLFRMVKMFVFFSFLAVPAFAASVRVEGNVHDSTGAIVAGARVQLRAREFSSSQNTDAQGHFIFDSVPAASGTLTVQADGFSDAQQEWAAEPGGVAKLEIALTPANIKEEVFVTATRTELRLGDVAVSSVALRNEDLDATAALTADDKLRQIPGFTLFRRSGSRTANPTSQGVSLSGLGASGASRALVLEGGVPLTDPFGGWVYWGRVPQESVQSVELVRRGISNLYGSDGLAGAIQFMPRPVETPAFSLETSYGTEKTPNVSFWGGSAFGKWDAAISTDLFHTDGYVLVPTSIRGTTDTRANSEHAAVEVTLGRSFGKKSRVFGRGSYFTESRNNGTGVQFNDTQLAQGVLGADTQSDSLGSFSFRLYGQPQSYDQSFSSVAADRNSESLSDLQHVPAQQLGISGWWSKAVARQVLVAGFDGAEVMGWSNESIFNSGTHLRDTIAGGRQRTSGVYGQDILSITPRWIVTVGGRFDHWRNFDAESVRTSVTPPGATTTAPFAERSENAFSPRISLLHQLTNNVSLTVSTYRGFRAPTLNELYRAFRVGNVQTQANENLKAERLTGAEAGANVFAFNRRLNLRGNFFWDDIVNPIANVTLNATSNPIQRQRQNLGRTRSRGVELDAIAHMTRNVELSGGYQFVDATVLSFPADPVNNPSLLGNQIPQIPRNQFTLQARYWNPSRLMFSVQGRFVGDQFDDDVNSLLLDRYFALDLFVGRELGRGVEVFAAGENITNQRYDIAKTPTPNIGPPILGRIGVRFNFPARH